MSQRKRASSRNRRPQSHEVKRGSNDPPDTFVPIDDLVEGAVITGPAAGRPKLTVWWSEEDLGKWLAITSRIRCHFIHEVKRTGRRVLKKDGVPYIMSCDSPSGAKISEHMAKVIFTLCRDMEDMSGGLLGKKDD